MSLARDHRLFAVAELGMDAALLEMSRLRAHPLALSAAGASGDLHRVAILATAAAAALNRLAGVAEQVQEHARCDGTDTVVECQCGAQSTAYPDDEVPRLCPACGKAIQEASP